MTGEKKGKMDLTITMNSYGNINFEEDGQKNKLWICRI